MKVTSEYFARLCEEADAAMEGGWTWAFPNTPFTLRTCIAATDATFVKAVKTLG